jgi:hypothetical protein
MHKLNTNNIKLRLKARYTAEIVWTFNAQTKGDLGHNLGLYKTNKSNIFYVQQEFEALYKGGCHLMLKLGLMWISFFLSLDIEANGCDFVIKKKWLLLMRILWYIKVSYNLQKKMMKQFKTILLCNQCEL